MEVPLPKGAAARSNGTGLCPRVEQKPNQLVFGSTFEKVDLEQCAF